MSHNNGYEDEINHPAHYTQGKYECIDVIEDQNWPFNIASAIQYLWRYRYKGVPEKDLGKALWYIRRELDRIAEQERVACENIQKTR